MRRAGLTLCAMFFATAACAQEAPPKGMPQLDVGNPLTISQVVWLALIFSALYLLLSRWALPQVGAVLAHRATVIGDDLEAARAAKTAADSAVGELTAATRKAHAEAQGEIAAAVAEAKKAASDQAAVLNARLDSQLAAAETRIGEARATAVGALRQVATEAAQMVVTRLTGMTPDPAALAGAVDAALAARG